MEAPASARLFDSFAHVRDPRSANARHRFFEIFVIARCAVLSGAEGWEAREEYGQAQAEGFQQCLELPPGMPAHATFRRVLSRLQPAELPQGFGRWPEALRESLDGDIVAIAGQTLRRAFAQAAAQSAMHLVSAWANAHRLGLGQRKVEDQSQELTALPKRLRLVELEGAMVTIDARGGQKAMAQTLTEPGAEYVLALQDNQPTLPGEGPRLFDDSQAKQVDHIIYDHHTTIDADHGRLATRPYWSTSDSECGGVQGSGAKSTSVGLVEAPRAVGGEVAREPRVFLPSLPGEAGRFAQAMRQPWGVEKARHGGLEVSCRADDGRIRQGHGAQNMAVLRHRALQLWRQEAGHTRGIKARRQRAGGDRDYLLQVVAG